MQPEPGTALLELYDAALPHVYGYLLSRSGNRALAEDLTAETFLAAVAAVRGRTAPPLSTAWVVGIARHKLVDHWRRAEREERSLRLVHNGGVEHDEPWEARLDGLRIRQVLDELGPHHRAALTLRYLDGLSVPEVAEHLGRTVHATEALLVRARAAFRSAYGGEGDTAMTLPVSTSRRWRCGWLCGEGGCGAVVGGVVGGAVVPAAP
ncbi:MAG: sigma-70 family RNA polymerase sigma factor, partial [Streptosporangiales bacterium]|nr:sigma-70 family RNA polymerase sigma factor [Streptosporangiales bacterium]